MIGYGLWGQSWFEPGQHGVQLFFVLSGYLITSHLLDEERIDLKSFYVRRFFRLMPALWAFLGTLAVMQATGKFRVLDRSVWACVFFYRNYLPETVTNTPTGHLWSLSVEEQFYLVWPLLLLLAGRRRAAWIASAVALAGGIYALVFRDYYAEGLRYFHTEVRVSGLFVGCALAFLLREAAVRAWLARWRWTVSAGAVPVLAWDLYHVQRVIPLHESVVLAALVGATVAAPEMALTRVLEWEPLRMTGQASYSIYLWQGFFLRANWGVWGVLLLVVAYLLSWQFVEVPGMRLGRRLVARWQTRRRDPALSAVAAEGQAG
jgi:peptidoglycan/LPS O-acetylase OafA/YrhL